MMTYTNNLQLILLWPLHADWLVTFTWLHSSGLELSSLHGPTNSPELEVTHEVKATRPPLYEEPPMVNLLDLATVAPKPPPLFTLNDFVSEALA